MGCGMTANSTQKGFIVNPGRRQGLIQGALYGRYRGDSGRSNAGSLYGRKLLILNARSHFFIGLSGSSAFNRKDKVVLARQGFAIFGGLSGMDLCQENQYIQRILQRDSRLCCGDLSSKHAELDTHPTCIGFQINSTGWFPKLCAA